MKLMTCGEIVKELFDACKTIVCACCPMSAILLGDISKRVLSPTIEIC